MGKKGFLGEFEQIVLLALVRAADGAHGRAIYEEIERTALAPVGVTAVYVTLARLEKKGYVSSRLGAATPVRGGRAKKQFHIEPEGRQALQRSREQLDRFWAGVRLDPGTDRR